MKLAAAIALVFTAGCAQLNSSSVPVPPDTIVPTIAARSAMTFEGSLRRFLGPSRYLRLDGGAVGADAIYDYAVFGAEWGIESGWEGIYHSRVIFAKKHAEKDWSAARVFIDPRPSPAAFEGPISFLEEKGSEFGKPKPYPTEKGPDLLVIPGTHP